MLRKLAIVFSLAGMLIPASVFALGLGDVDLKSSLNQRLKAEIEILSVDASEMKGVKVSLASPQEFRKAGIDYNANLKTLRLKVIRKSNGKYYIKVTSTNNFREPYLNILVQVSWSKGRILREYALLIDPPVVVPTTGRQFAEDKSEPVRKADKQEYRASAEADDGKEGITNPYTEDDKDPKTTKKPETVAKKAPDANPFSREADKYPRIEYGLDDNKSADVDLSDTGDGSRYKVKAGDTMFEIAKRLRRGNMTLHQTMMAIKKANPNAFINNNVHLVKANVSLVIPDSATIEALNHNEAIRQYQAQTQVWRQGSQAPVTIARVEKKKSTGPKRGKFDLLPPSKDTKVTGKTETAKVSANKKDGSVSGDVNDDLAKAKRSHAVEDWRANAEKTKKELLAQIKAKKRILDIKSTAGATIQTQAEKRLFCQNNKFDRNCFKVNGYDKVDPAKLKNLGKNASPAFNSVDATEASLVGKAKALLDKTVAYFKENPVMAAGIGGGVLFLLILMFLIIRQYRRSRAEFEESILDFEEDSVMRAKRGGNRETIAKSLPASSVPASVSSSAVGGESVNNDDSSYLSDFVVSSMDDIHSDSGESDPLTEADVFFAYGKYEAAEMLVKEAIQNEPDRTDLRYKLLEIYHGAKNKDGFEFEASELYDRVADKSDPAWQKVEEMGRELAPENSMFGGSGAPAAAPAAPAPAPAAEAPADDFDSLDFDSLESLDDVGSMGGLDEAPAEKPAAPAASDASADGDFDLDFDFDVSDGGQGDDLAAELAKFEEENAVANSENVVSFNQGDASSDFAANDIGASYDSDSSMMSDVDEVGTKLDLAKAYIDMGDPEGARSILDEVLEEGNEAQRGEAQELMQQMAS